MLEEMTQVKKLIQDLQSNDDDLFFHQEELKNYLNEVEDIKNKLTELHKSKIAISEKLSQELLKEIGQINKKLKK